jgi:hypothetical protein
MGAGRSNAQLAGAPESCVVVKVEQKGSGSELTKRQGRQLWQSTIMQVDVCSIECWLRLIQVDCFPLFGCLST